MKINAWILSGTAVVALTLIAPLAMAQDAAPITWWYEQANPTSQGHLKDILVDPFNAAHPDQNLTIDFRGTELDKQLRVAMLSGEGPDVVYTPGPAYVAAMAGAGQLLSLDDYAASLGWADRILPVFLNMGTYDGHLYALPKTYETLGLFYNKTLFAPPAPACKLRSYRLRAATRRPACPCRCRARARKSQECPFRRPPASPYSS